MDEGQVRELVQSKLDLSSIASYYLNLFMYILVLVAIYWACQRCSLAYDAEEKVAWAENESEFKKQPKVGLCTYY